MIDLFKEPFTFNYGQVIPPNWNYIKRDFSNRLKTIIEYYRSRVYKVKNNHYLVNILYNILPPLDYDDMRFVDICKARSPYLSKTFYMASALNYGRCMNGIFFSKEDREIIIYDDSSFNLRFSKINWINLKPVRVVKTPISNLGLMLANGKDTSDEKGLCIVKVNITLLAYMYKCFAESNISKDISYSLFIHCFVLPNMLEDQLDHAVINRLMKIYYNQPTGKATARHAITFSNNEDMIDKALNFEVKELAKKSMRYDMVLKNILTITSNNAQEFLLVGKFIPTRQQEWVYLISRLEIFKFLLDIEGEKGTRYNKDTITKMGRELRYIKGDNANFILDMPEEETKKIKSIVDEILSYC